MQPQQVSRRTVIRHLSRQPRSSCALASKAFTFLFVMSWGVLANAPALEGAEVSPDVLRQFGREGESTFLVLFREQAVLTPAYAISDWQEKGRFVYERLTTLAESTQAPVRGLLQARGARFSSYWIVNGIYVTTDDRMLVTQLAERPDVAGLYAPGRGGVASGEMGMGPQLLGTAEWHIERVGASEVWSTYGARGQGIVVANIDDGVMLRHPVVVRQYRGNLGDGSFDHDYSWFDGAELCGSPSLEPCDVGPGHGTATMGVMVGDDDLGNRIGMAPDARWIAAVTDFSDPSLLSAAQWLLAPTDLAGADPDPDQRPHVINNSWAGPGGNPWYRAAVQAWVAAGIFPTFAAGNQGPSCGSIRSPGDYPESYAVGASDFDDNLGVFSARGPSLFGVAKPDLVAPGKDVRGAVVPGGPWDPDGDGFAVDSVGGTSWSAPHVGGAVALLWSGRPELIGNVALTREALGRSASGGSDPTCGGTASGDNSWGEGLLDVKAAFEFDLVFVDGFETGDTGMWSSVSP